MEITRTIGPDSVHVEAKRIFEEAGFLCHHHFHGVDVYEAEPVVTYKNRLFCRPLRIETRTKRFELRVTHTAHDLTVKILLGAGLQFDEALAVQVVTELETMLLDRNIDQKLKAEFHYLQGGF